MFSSIDTAFKTTPNHAYPSGTTYPTKEDVFPSPPESVNDTIFTVGDPTGTPTYAWDLVAFYDMNETELNNYLEPEYSLGATV